METKTAVARIFVLESHRAWRKLIKRLFNGSPLLVQFAGSVEGARKAISGQKVDLLVVSDCAGRSDYRVGKDVLAFVKEVHEKRPGLQIVANSSNCNYGKALQEAGCICQTPRSHLDKKLREILKLPG